MNFYKSKDGNIYSAVHGDVAIIQATKVKTVSKLKFGVDFAASTNLRITAVTITSEEFFQVLEAHLKTLNNLLSIFEYKK